MTSSEGNTTQPSRIPGERTPRASPGPDELAFAREILDQQIRSAEGRLDEIAERLDDLAHGLT